MLCVSFQFVVFGVSVLSSQSLSRTSAVCVLKSSRARLFPRFVWVRLDL